MYELYEVVVAQKQLSEKVPKGTSGTVLLSYTSPYVAYEVEFVDLEGQSLDVLTVKEDDITKLPKAGFWKDED